MSQMGLQLFRNYLYYIVWKKAHNQNFRKLPKMGVYVSGLFWPTTLSKLLEKGMCVPNLKKNGQTLRLPERRYIYIGFKKHSRLLYQSG